MQIIIGFQAVLGAVKKKNSLPCEEWGNSDEIVRKCSTFKATFEQTA